MAKESQIRRELLQIVAAIVEQDAAPQQFERINAILLEYPHAATLLAEAIWLTSVLEHRGWEGQINELASAKALAAIPLINPMSQAPPEQGSACQDDAIEISPASQAPKTFGRIGPGLVSILAALAIAASLMLVGWIGVGVGQPGRKDIASEANSLAGPPVRGSSAEIAALVSASANCQWRPGFDPMSVGSGLQRGREIGIVDGIAFLQCLSGVLARLEGPSTLDVTYDYQPRLLDGVSTFVLPWHYDTNCVELRTVRIFGGPAEFGCICSGGKSEIHCFHGAISVEAIDGSDTFQLSEGESAKFRDDASRNSLGIVFGRAQQSRFQSLQADRGQLSIPPQYIESVRRSEPLAYWRFEELRESDGETLIDNEMGPLHPLRVHGTVLPVSEPDNRCVEMGTWDREGYLFVKDPLKELANESYSIECWLKLKHHQYSTIVALVKDVGNEWSWRHHAVLLEAGSPELVTRGYRYLHRLPPSSNWQEGVNCMSDSTYSVGKWQHVVIVKDQKETRLYLDGVLSGREHTTNTPLPPTLHLIVGRAYKPTRGRSFMGRLDELCIYPRALQPTEISERYEIIRKAMRDYAEIPQGNPDPRNESDSKLGPSA